MHSGKILKLCVSKNFTKFSEKHLCWSLLIKKETPTQAFSFKFCQISKNTFFYRTSPVVASVVLLSWLWNYVQSQQQKDKVRFVGSLRGRRAGVPVKQVLSSDFWVVYDDFCWLWVISDGFCRFSSYTNFTTYRGVISLLYFVFLDWGHLVFLFKVRQQERYYCCLVA